MNPPVVPDHTLLRPIGRGAYGEVWLARNLMGAWRAVKIIWRRQFESQRPYEREFAGIQRYEPVSRSSGGLVHVLHVGRNETEGYFYYVMELADPQAANGTEIETNFATPVPQSTDLLAGYQPRTLRSEMKRLGRLPTTACLRLALDVASGLAELHRHGLVHRDVKPGNIIYVNGRAKLADLGLVSAGGEGQTFVGTEGYIPPEGPGTPSADLYALGIATYEASTGHPPDRFPDVPAYWFAEDASTEALEFHEVILKACESQRDRRYESAEAMQADLALLQSGRSVRRARTLERRYALLRWGGIIGSSLFVCALAAFFFANYRAQLAAESRAKEAALREQAQASLARAERAEQAARHQLYTALLEQGRANVRSGELGQRTKALDAVRVAAGISNSAALRGVALAAHALPDLRFERELPYGNEFPMRSVDPAFERIALSRGRGPVEIRSTTNLSLLATLIPSTNLPAYGAHWSPDGRYLAIKRDYPPGGASSDKEVWDARSGRLVIVQHDAPFSALSFHPRLPRVLVGRSNGAVVRDLETGTEVSRIELNRTPLYLCYSPEGERFAATFSTKGGWFVSVHRTGSGELISSNSFDAFVGSYNWHPSGRWLAVPDYSSRVSRFDAETGEKRLLGRHKAQATETGFSSDGNYLMSGGWDRELLCWDARTLQHPLTIWLNGYFGWFRADGHAFALQTDAAVQFHTFERDSGHREFAEDLGPLVRSAAFSADGRWLAAAGTERIGVWDLQNSGPGAMTTSAQETRVAFAATGELFADHLGGANRWRVLPGAGAASPPELAPLELALPERFASLCVISNGAVLTGARGSAVVQFGDLGGGKRDWLPTEWGYNGVSDDGGWLAVFQPYTSQLHVHRLPGLERVAILTNDTPVRAFQFSPAGGELAVACRNGVAFWDTATWQRTRASAEFNSQRYSADGRTMWLTQQYRAGGLYNARTLELLMPLPIGTYPLAVSPDGRRLAVSVDLRRLQVWDLAEARQQLAQLGLDWRE